MIVLRFMGSASISSMVKMVGTVGTTNVSVAGSQKTILAPGNYGTLMIAGSGEVDLKPGTYAINCPLPFHTMRGMKTTLTVK